MKLARRRGVALSRSASSLASPGSPSADGAPEDPLAVLKQVRDRLVEHEPLEVLGVRVGLERRLVGVLLVQEEAGRVLGVLVWLELHAARLLARGPGELVDHRGDAIDL